MLETNHNTNKFKEDLRLDTSSFTTKGKIIILGQDVPCDVKEEESGSSTESQGLTSASKTTARALFCAQNDVESPLTELKRAFDMLQSSSFFVDESMWEKKEKEDGSKTTESTTKEEIDLPVILTTNSNRHSRLQKSRPASLCIQDSARDYHSIIRTPSVPPTTLTFLSSVGTPSESEPKSAMLPFYLDDEKQCNSPHVHFSDQQQWQTNNIPTSSKSINTFLRKVKDQTEINSSPAFANPFCFENSHCSSICSSDSSCSDSRMIMGESSKMNAKEGLGILHSFQSDISLTSSSIISNESENILTAPPTLERAWHRGNRGGDKKQDQSSKSNLLRLPSTFNNTMPSSANKKHFMNRGGMRSASATTSSTFRNAIQSLTFKRNSSFQNTESKQIHSSDREYHHHQEGLDENRSNAKMYGLAIGNQQDLSFSSLSSSSAASNSSSSHKRKTKQNRHPSKSPYPIQLCKMPSPSSPPRSASSASVHFQSPMMASYFATLG